jgi:hypothetical protein
MRNVHPSHPHTATPNRVGQESPVSGRRAARRPSPQLISEAVVAAYIHDISKPDRHASHTARPALEVKRAATGSRAPTATA